MLKSNLGIDVIGHVVVGLRVSFRPIRAYSLFSFRRIRSYRLIQWILVISGHHYLFDSSVVTGSPVDGSTSNGPGRSNSLAISRTAGMTSSPIKRRLRIASS